VAKEVITRLLDDLDGSEADETVRFGLDGRQYEIDLNTKNGEKLRKALAPYLEKARLAGGAGGGRRGSARRRGADRDFEPAAVREWAAKKGIPLSTRGRIPGDVVEKYKAAKK
jgi:hypothetical protein